MVAVRRQSDAEVLKDGASAQSPLKAAYGLLEEIQSEALGAPRTPPKAASEALEDIQGEVQLPRRIRRDALPEHTQYADTGCEVHPNCLTCPLVRCRYDEPGGARRLLSEGRDRQIVELRRCGEGINQIARRFGVSRRTVFRALARSLV